MSLEEQLAQHALTTCWSLWTELGVPGWARSHPDRAIVPEHLIVFTAAVAERDPRLHKQALAWCARHRDLLSRRQLNHAYTQERYPKRQHPAEFLEALKESQKGLDGGARSLPLDRPALLPLRLRCLFGVSARADVLRILLNEPTAWRTTSALADEALYTRRQVTTALDRLVAGGLADEQSRHGTRTYRLTRPQALQAVLGEAPAHSPPWGPLLKSLSVFIDIARGLEERRWGMPSAELRRQFRLHEAELQRAGLWPPVGGQGLALVDTVTEWMLDVAESVSSGTFGAAAVAAGPEVEADHGQMGGPW